MARSSLKFAALLPLLLGACAETGDVPPTDAAPSYAYDAGAAGYDAGRPGSPSTGVPPATSAPRPTDGGTSAPPGEFDLGGLLGDGGLFVPSDGGGGGGGQKGELDPNGEINPKLPPKKDNPPECPSLAPPNPVGNCLGLPIYLLCGYGEEGGQQYSCTCDWYHWLCV